MISSKTLEFVLLVWLCLESGQFARAYLPWGNNSLYWPFWVAICLVVILGVNLLDRVEYIKARFLNDKESKDPLKHECTKGDK